MNPVPPLKALASHAYSIAAPWVRATGCSTALAGIVIHQAFYDPSFTKETLLPAAQCVLETAAPYAVPAAQCVWETAAPYAVPAAQCVLETVAKYPTIAILATICSFKVIKGNAAHYVKALTDATQEYRPNFWPSRKPHVSTDDAAKQNSIMKTVIQGVKIVSGTVVAVAGCCTSLPVVSPLVAMAGAGYALKQFIPEKIISEIASTTACNLEQYEKEETQKTKNWKELESLTTTTPESLTHIQESTLLSIAKSPQLNSKDLNKILKITDNIQSENNRSTIQKDVLKAITQTELKKTFSSLLFNRLSKNNKIQNKEDKEFQELCIAISDVSPDTGLEIIKQLDLPDSTKVLDENRAKFLARLSLSFLKTSKPNTSFLISRMMPHVKNTLETTHIESLQILCKELLSLSSETPKLEKIATTVIENCIREFYNIKRISDLQKEEFLQIFYQNQLQNNQLPENSVIATLCKHEPQLVQELGLLLLVNEHNASDRTRIINLIAASKNPDILDRCKTKEQKSLTPQLKRFLLVKAQQQLIEKFQEALELRSKDMKNKTGRKPCNDQSFLGAPENPPFNLFTKCNKTLIADILPKTEQDKNDFILANPEAIVILPEADRNNVEKLESYFYQFGDSRLRERFVTTILANQKLLMKEALKDGSRLLFTSMLSNAWLKLQSNNLFNFLEMAMVNDPSLCFRMANTPDLKEEAITALCKVCRYFPDTLRRLDKDHFSDKLILTLAEQDVNLLEHVDKNALDMALLNYANWTSKRKLNEGLLTNHVIAGTFSKSNLYIAIENAANRQGA